MIDVVRTKSLQDEIAYITSSLGKTNPFFAFATCGVPEVRQAYLKATERWTVEFGEAKEIERIATTLRLHNDQLWKEYAQAYLFCYGNSDVSMRAFRFILDWPEHDGTDYRFRSKALCNRLNRALLCGQRNIITAGKPFIGKEIRFFHDWCNTHTFYQDEEWYRLERAVKVAMLAGDWSVLDTLRLIVRLYRSKTRQLKVPWPMTDDMLFPIIRSQHLAFLLGAIAYLEQERRKNERKPQQVS